MAIRLDRPVSSFGARVSTGAVAREVIEAAGYPYYAAIGLEDLGLS